MKRKSRARPQSARRRTVVRLYVAGSSRNSLEARRNLHAVAGEMPDGTLDIEVIDVFKFPKRALADGILVTPTLIRLAPRPIEIVIGDLSDRDALRAIFGSTAERIGEVQ